MAPTYRSKWPEYASQWNRMAVKADRIPDIRRAAARLVSAKDRYLRAERITGVPWYLIAALHWRESAANFKTQLAQGDPLNRRSVHEPSGRGPFKSWEEGAYDALVRLKKLNRVKDWRLEKMLYYAEQYNGWGYHYHRMPSPYLWGGTTIQRRGKYVADGRYSPTTWDVQPGVAAMISQMMHLDPTISPLRES
jgi:lysozyme family protein